MIIAFCKYTGQDIKQLPPQTLRWIIKDRRIHEQPRLREAIEQRIQYLKRNPLELRTILDHEDPAPDPILARYLDRQIARQQAMIKAIGQNSTR